jgi:hypothetical protein
MIVVRTPLLGGWEEVELEGNRPTTTCARVQLKALRKLVGGGARSWIRRAQTHPSAGSGAPDGAAAERLAASLGWTLVLQSWLRGTVPAVSPFSAQAHTASVPFLLL